MLTRRLLIGSGLASAGALRLSAQRPTAKESAKSLPPSIAALQSMRDQVQPITNQERTARIERARQLMSEHKLDGILLAGGTSLTYFTGVRWGNSERLFAVGITAKGNSFCICPSFEEDRAREQLNQSPLESAKVITWHEDESPYKLLADELKSSGVADTIGIEEKTPFVFADGLAQASPQLKLKSATPVTAGCRMIKSAHELRLMTIANEATLKVYAAVYQALQPGMTQTQAGSLISSAYDKVGFHGFASVEVGQYSALPHGSLTPQVIHENQIVMIDDGCTVEGYQSDITRTFVLGKATDKMNHVFDVVYKAQSAALAAAKPGAECQSVDAAARKVISDAGFGPDYEHFTHRLGHGIGLDGHEWPYLVRGNALRIAPNMTFSDEPGIYIRGEFGVRLEDDMYITEDGAKLFTPRSHSLENPFA